MHNHLWPILRRRTRRESFEDSTKTRRRTCQNAARAWIVLSRLTSLRVALVQPYLGSLQFQFDINRSGMLTPYGTEITKTVGQDYY